MKVNHKEVNKGEKNIWKEFKVNNNIAIQSILTA